MVLTQKALRSGMIKSVLIPSDSGHGSNTKTGVILKNLFVLIPSDSGHGSNIGLIGLAVVVVLIPSDSGHGSNLRAVY